MKNLKTGLLCALICAVSFGVSADESERNSSDLYYGSIEIVTSDDCVEEIRNHFKKRKRGQMGKIGIIFSNNVCHLVTLSKISEIEKQSISFLVDFYRRSTHWKLLEETDTSKPYWYATSRK